MTRAASEDAAEHQQEEVSEADLEEQEEEASEDEEGLEAVLVRPEEGLEEEEVDALNADSPDISHANAPTPPATKLETQAALSVASPAISLANAPTPTPSPSASSAVRQAISRANAPQAEAPIRLAAINAARPVTSLVHAPTPRPPNVFSAVRPVTSRASAHKVVVLEEQDSEDPWEELPAAAVSRAVNPATFHANALADLVDEVEASEDLLAADSEAASEVDEEASEEVLEAHPPLEEAPSKVTNRT